MKWSGRLVFAIIVALCVVLIPTGIFAAVQTDQEVKADALKIVGLFAGTPKGDQLYRQPLRTESTVMMLRLTGEENEAKNGHYTHPFRDVPDWANNYVGYAYQKGIVKGMEDGSFGADKNCDLQQYLTLVLRALGYADDGSLYDNSIAVAEKAGLLDSAVSRTHFGRGEMVQVSYNALGMKMQSSTAQKPVSGESSEASIDAAKESGSLEPSASNATLADILIQKGVFTQEKLDQARQRVAEGPREVRAVYLTFDDGPSTNVTPVVLDTLKENDVQATFFLVGSSINAHPELVQREYAEGHALANHSFSHKYSYIYKNSQNLLADMDSCNVAINAALGFDHPVQVFRFPGGSHNKAQYLKDTVTAAGYRYYDWNCAGNDAISSKPVSADYVYNSTVNTTPKSGDVIVLYHDASTKTSSAQALPWVIEYFRSNGFVFRTL